MSLGWSDLRRTVRRSGDGTAQAYPFLLRDERLHPRISLAVQYFESMVGRPRAEMDSEVLVQFFADHRLARGIVAALAGHYRYRRLGFADALEPAVRARLAAVDLHTPADLRAALYADVNAHHGGFAAGATRATALDRLASRVDLAASVVDSLLLLDAEDRAPLARLAPAAPSAAEVAAIYNHLVVDALLRTAARVELDVAPGAEAFVASLARRGEALGVGLEAGRKLTLLGERDGVGSWTRQGRRLVRALTQALVRWPGAVRGGSAIVEWRDAEYVCRLTEDYWRALVGPGVEGATSARFDGDAGREVDWEPRRELAALRRRGQAVGWSLRGWPGALVYPEGVLFPEFALQNGHRSVMVVLADVPALVGPITRLAPRLVARGDVLLVGMSETLPALGELPLPTVALDEAGPLAAVLAAAPALLRPTAPGTAPALDRLLAAVQDAGFLPLDRALELAACTAEADLAAQLGRLQSPAIRLVPGLGVHTADFVGRLQAASA